MIVVLPLLLLLFAEFVDELKRCGPTYSLWAALEGDLAEPLRGVADCLERCCSQTEEHIHFLSEVLVPAVHEYVLCADTVKVRAPPHRGGSVCGVKLWLRCFRL